MPRFLLVFFAVLPLALAAPAVAQPGGPQQATPVAVSPVIERDVPEDRTFVGTVHAAQTSVIGSAVDGRVEEMVDEETEETIEVDVGDWVTKGQKLTELRKETIGLEIAAAKAELLLRERELDELNEGSRPDEIKRAAAELQRATALSDFAKSRWERTNNLIESARSDEEFEQNQSSWRAAEAARAAAEANWRLVVDGPRQEKILQAEARVAIQEAEIERLVDRMSKYTIRAPFNGYIVAKYAEVGQWLSAADPVVEMVSADPIEVWVSVPEEHIAFLAPGGKATVQLDALHNWLPATIKRIVPQADMRSRSFPIRLELENPREEHGHLIKPGMLARVAVVVGEPGPSLLVPKDALVLGGDDGPVVYVIKVDPRTGAKIAERVPVVLGVAYNSHIRVDAELEVGQEVVVLGNERLRPGTQVRIVPRRQD